MAESTVPKSKQVIDAGDDFKSGGRTARAKGGPRAAASAAVSRGKSSEVTTDQRVASYVERHRVPIVAVAALVVAGVIGYTVASIVSSKAVVSNLAKIDAISKTMTADSATLDDAALDVRRSTAMEALTPLVKKSGVAGVRANMLSAEIAWQQGNYTDAERYWRSAAAKGGKAYTAPLAMMNEAAAAEASGQWQQAAELYGKAAKTEDFMLKSTALFNEGRAWESVGEWDKARGVYTELTAAYSDQWAHLAQSRLIALDIEGK